MSKLQTIIIPRNWLFGRLCYIMGNLSNIINYNKMNFTDAEMKDLKEAQSLIRNIVVHKKKSSEILKKNFRNNLKK